MHAGILSLVLFLSPVAAWENLGPREGLTGSSVTTIGQDPSGFLWLATQNGLNRWDGTAMTVWQNDPFSANTLGHNLVQSMTIDGDKLWLGTYGGLDLFDPATGEFRHFAHQDSQPDSLSHDVVLRILRDSHGRVWVGTLGGLNLLDESAGTFRLVGAPTATIRALTEDSAGRLWVGTATGLELISDDGTSLVSFASLFPGKILPQGGVMGVLSEPGAETLWLGIWGQGLVSLDTRTGATAVFPVADNRIFQLTRGPDGQILAATWGGGLVFFNPITRTSTVETHREGDTSTLAHNVVYGTFTDRQGILWVATNGGGASFRDPSPNRFPSFSANGKVTALFRDSRERLWAGLYNNGVGLFDLQNGVERSWGADIVNDIAEDPRGQLWWATNAGLVRFDPDKGLTGRWSVAEGLPDEILTSLLFEPDDMVWMGTYRHGIVHRPLPGTIGPETRWLDGLLVNFVRRDSQGRLWVGTNSGVARFEAEKDQFRRWSHQQEDRSSLAGNSVRAMFEDSRGNLWFATNGGLSLYKEETATFETFGREKGLRNLTVLSIQEDRVGSLWVGTSDGLYRLAADRSGFVSFDDTDGLPNAEFYRGSLRLSSGELVFGGAGFITAFVPETTNRSGPVPRVTLTGITVGNTLVPTTTKLNLSWQQNSVILSFALMDFLQPSRHQYSYRLEGFDKAWTEVGSRHEARYTNLPAGNYNFLFRGKASEQIWAEGEPVVVTVEEVPWRQWYALFGYALLAGFVAFLAVKVVLDRHLAQKVVELEGLRAQLLDANAKLDQLSRLDGLTGIPNRRALDSWLDNEWALAARQRQRVALIMLDIDYFKRFNDSYGHLVGDSCLKAVAKVLAESLHRTTDFCARFGGEEFVVILHDTELDGALQVAQRLLEAVDELAIPHETSTVHPFVSISLGVAAMQPDQDKVPQALLQLADQALYRAKSLGRRRVNS